jgi:leader peptidase (prepilin peptidase)/N-methyltransferase
MITASIFPFVSLVVFIFGAMIGSFLNVCIIRLPKDESIVTPPSHCPHCNAEIPFYDNIPLLSYLILRGRCRFCRERISPRYFSVELLMGGLAVALLFHFGLSAAYFVYFAFAAALVVISFIDLDEQIIPDAITLPGIGLGLIAALLQYPWPTDPLAIPPSLLSSALGAFIGAGCLFLVARFYEALTGIEGMGGGDLTLLAMIGAFLGWPAIPLGLFFASLAGSIIGVILMLATGAGRKLKIPFGPFLCLGALFYLFFGRAVAESYLSFLSFG